MQFEPPQIAGLALMALFGLLVGWLALRRQPRAIKLFALALLLVGLGYLATTKAPTDVIRLLFGAQY